MDRFLGTWVLGKSENFEEYLTARGVPWMVRKMMQMSWITKTFTENAAAGTYTLINKSPMSTLAWTFKFKETMEGMGFDGKKHAITFDCKDNTLFETHVRVDDVEKKPETYKYVRDGDFIILNLEHKGINAKRFFKKQA